jgi:hypothetical protein
MNQMIPEHAGPGRPRHRRGWARNLTGGALAVGIAAVALLWSWNKLLHGLLAWPELKFTQALALLLGVAALGLALGAALHLGARVTRGREEIRP